MLDVEGGMRRMNAVDREHAVLLLGLIPDATGDHVAAT
jgi:hypothetical protein